MKKLFFLAAIMLVAASCQKLQYPQWSSDNSLSGLKCFVHYDPDNPTVKQEVNLLSGTFNRERGLISYTFDDPRFTDEALKRCRIEATIAATATLVMADAAGNKTAEGFNGFYDLGGNTLYFCITAADGSEKFYQLNCKK